MGQGFYVWNGSFRLAMSPELLGWGLYLGINWARHIWLKMCWTLAIGMIWALSVLMSVFIHMLKQFLLDLWYGPPRLGIDGQWSLKIELCNVKPDIDFTFEFCPFRLMMELISLGMDGRCAFKLELGSLGPYMGPFPFDYALLCCDGLFQAWKGLTIARQTRAGPLRSPIWAPPHLSHALLGLRWALSGKWDGQTMGP